MDDNTAWPALPLAAWTQTRDTLHMYTQIMGKIRLALMPPEPQWANVPLFISARGFTTHAMPCGERYVQLDLDCIAHVLDIAVSDGQRRSIALIPALSVADFYEQVMAALDALGIAVKIWPMQVEVANPLLCTEDRVHSTYEPDDVRRFWTILVRIAAVFMEWRAPFRGRHTPVQFFWGTFDLNYVRYSGHPAEPPPNADRITRVAMDSQEIAAGFWPGDDRLAEPAFFCYSYPKPAGIERAALQPAGATYDETMGEFILRYDDVRRAASPRAAILNFLASTYNAGATSADWDRAALDGQTAGAVTVAG